MDQWYALLNQRERHTEGSEVSLPALNSAPGLPARERLRSRANARHGIGTVRLIAPDAFFQAYRNRKATFECLRSFRTHNPDAVIHLVSDGGADLSDIARLFNCNYERKEHIGTEPLDRMRMERWLRRVEYAAAHSTAEYVINLEDDVLIRGEIWRPGNWAIAGPYHGRATFSKSLYTYLRRRNPRVTSDNYGGCGGSIFNRTAFLQAAKAFDFAEFAFYESLDSRVRARDALLTLIFLLDGHEYTSLEDVFCEANGALYPGWETNGKPIVHQFKQFYGKPLDAADQALLVQT